MQLPRDQGTRTCPRLTRQTLQSPGIVCLQRGQYPIVHFHQTVLLIIFGQVGYYAPSCLFIGPKVSQNHPNILPSISRYLHPVSPLAYTHYPLKSSPKSEEWCTKSPSYSDIGPVLHWIIPVTCVHPSPVSWLQNNILIVQIGQEMSPLEAW
jgi:hypothetical protein